jgi:hypothetical protein
MGHLNLYSVIMPSSHVSLDAFAIRADMSLASVVIQFTEQSSHMRCLHWPVAVNTVSFVSLQMQQGALVLAAFCLVAVAGFRLIALVCGLAATRSSIAVAFRLAAVDEEDVFLVVVEVFGFL